MNARVSRGDESARKARCGWCEAGVKLRPYLVYLDGLALLVALSNDARIDW
jgi:hypothetical protein